MAIRKGQRITPDRIKKEKKRFKKIAAVYEKTNLSKVELYISNYHHAMYKTIEKFDNAILDTEPKLIGLEKEYIEVLLWLYQFEWFEWEWAASNFIFAHSNKRIFKGRKTGKSKFMTKKMALLYRNDFIEGTDYYEYEYKDLEKKDEYTAAKVQTTAARYNVSLKGVQVVKEFYSNLVDDSPSKVYKRQKRLIWSQQKLHDFNDYDDF